VAQYDRVIPPGGQGKITLKVRTRGYQGKVVKSARVYSNDPGKKSALLRMTGIVKVPIALNPRSVYLYGVEGQSVSRAVEIRSQLQGRLELIPLEFNLQDKLEYTLEEIEKGRRYRVRFTSPAGPPRTFRGFLKLKTNYPQKPILTVWVRGRIRKKAPPPQPRSIRRKGKVPGRPEFPRPNMRRPGQPAPPPPPAGR